MQYKGLTKIVVPFAAATVIGASLGIFCNSSKYEENPLPTYTPTATYTSTPSPTPSPTPDPIYDLQRSLEQKVRGYEEGTGMNISIAVTDLQARKTISVDGREPHRTGCVINQFPLYMIADEAQKGNLDVAEMDWYIRNSVDHSNPASTGTFLTYYFGSETEGVRRTQQWMDDHEIDGIYNHVPTHGAENWTDNILSANETNEALTELYSRKLFNKEWTDYVMDVLTYDNFYYGIPAGTDSDAVVAHNDRLLLGFRRLGPWRHRNCDVS